MEKEGPYTRGIPQDNWSTPFNPFNSMKYLLWREHLEAIVKNDFLVPYMVDIDPSNICNYNCIFCNSNVFRKQSPTMIPPEHLLKIADFIKEWGVKSACVSGGGEPMTNPGFTHFLRRLHKNNIKIGVISNGSLMNEEQASAIVDTCSWCGFSIDAGTKETFSKVHNVKPEIFDQVIGNLKKLVKLKKERNSNIQITFKFLLHPLNANEIYTASINAKFIGCDVFHLRPVCWDNLYGQSHDKPISYSSVIDTINKQIEQAQWLENDKFQFFGIRHKFGAKLERKVNFKKCLATPMMTTFGADGNVHLCFDVRGKSEWILCKHYPDPHKILDVWNSKKHKKIIESIDPNNCPRCTFSVLQEIIEEVIIKDKMFKDFL